MPPTTIDKPFKYSCFISYRYGKHDHMKTVTEELKKALDNYLEEYFETDVYIDKERLKGGDIFDPILAKAICESVCMIMIYRPKYFSREKPFCTKEYKYMTDLETKRLKIIGNSNSSEKLIIPIITNNINLPNFIRNDYTCYDFVGYEGSPAHNEKFRLLIKCIAVRIFNLYSKFKSKNFHNECENVTLQNDDEIESIFAKIEDSQNEFPGRPNSLRCSLETCFADGKEKCRVLEQTTMK